ncbi:hypothetical protein EV421DRAFT_1915295 [Armillaria borealis]|uniref:Uncharacterized protein n=1 Tax=Armillaria borealis TaxID=47425 RepID=A0AA39ICA1_9AGAR|nr:hypothetical protein EV421DRAFT_1915295 [Armillaria borealis]
MKRKIRIITIIEETEVNDHIKAQVSQIVVASFAVVVDVRGPGITIPPSGKSPSSPNTHPSHLSVAEVKPPSTICLAVITLLTYPAVVVILVAATVVAVRL